ncbi:hypothetical protein BOTCAL_0370g00060 [Botryotinia calthae]|uniref:Uncharacterized protein n=1 Tax=Botryotinia calthae TaxID=38488 RepID=A0A4Y8CUI3_9HELO|nr:hypothetical protein BOTCAL_0370g00060 [Botryotinia calthae]
MLVNSQALLVQFGIVATLETDFLDCMIATSNLSTHLFGEIENQGSVTGNDDLDEIKNQDQQDSEDSSSLQLTPTSTAEFVIELDYQSMRRISAKTEVDHSAAPGEGADANHEVETASHAAAHVDSLDPMNSPCVSTFFLLLCSSPYSYSLGFSFLKIAGFLCLITLQR